MKGTRPDYDTPEFEALWYSPTPLHVIAKKYGVHLSNVAEAAKRRGLPPKVIAEGATFRLRLLAVIEYCGGKASVEDAQQWFASRYGARYSRGTMQYRLRNLAHRGKITRLPGRTSYYTA